MMDTDGFSNAHDSRFDSCTPALLPFDLTGRRVFVAGHRGMVGAALIRRLKPEHCEVLTADRATANQVRSRSTLPRRDRRSRL